MRLLFIANDFPNPREPTLGTFNLSLVKALADRHEVGVIAPVSWITMLKKRNAPGETGQGEEHSVDGVTVYRPTYHYVPKLFRGHYGWFYWQSIRRTVWRMLRTFEPDVVMGYWIHPDGEAAVRAAEIIGVPSVVLVGGSDLLLITKNARRRRCVQRVLGRADAVLAVSDNLRSKAIELGTPPAKAHLWHRGVDTTAFSPGDGMAARSKLGLPPDVPILLWVGRMVPVKAVHVLIQACAILKSRNEPFHLCLVGEGELRGSLERQAERAGLTGNITFAGAQLQHALPDWYRAATLMVLPSLSEGIPNVLREAGACGTPFVASNVGGIPEIACSGTDELVPPGDAAAMADAIARVLARPGSVANKPKPRSWTQSADALVDILRPLVASSLDPTYPWWASCPQGAKPPAAAHPSPVRQMARHVLGMTFSRRRIIINGPSDSRRVSLTFDDGPHPVHTQRLLAVLREHDVRATFFVLGHLASRHPEIVRAIVADGHQVASHGYFHTKHEKMSAFEAVTNSSRCVDSLRRAGADPVTCYRPPHGRMSAWNLLKFWTRGQTVALWSLDPRDYACTSTEELAARLGACDVHGGDVVLLHDRLPHAAEVLPDFIRRVRKMQMVFCRLDEWIDQPGTVPVEPHGRPVMAGLMPERAMQNRATPATPATGATPAPAHRDKTC